MKRNTPSCVFLLIRLVFLLSCCKKMFSANPGLLHVSGLSLVLAAASGERAKERLREGKVGTLVKKNKDLKAVLSKRVFLS